MRKRTVSSVNAGGETGQPHAHEKETQNGHDSHEGTKPQILGSGTGGTLCGAGHSGDCGSDSEAK